MKNLMYFFVICATIFCCNTSTVFGQSSQTAIGSLKFGDQILNPDSNIELPIILDNVPGVGAISLGIHYDPNTFQFIGASTPASGMFLLGFENHTIKIAWVTLPTLNSFVPVSFDTITRLQFHYIGIGCDTFAFIHHSNYEIADMDGNSYNITYGENIEICQPLSTGINDNEDDNVNIYSSNNIVYIHNTDYTSVEVYDILGRIVHKDNLVANQNNSFTLAAKGVFIVKVTNSKNSITQKIKL